jgi:hypothetical protein
MFAWAGATASGPMRTDPAGSRGLDDYFTRSPATSVPRSWAATSSARSAAHGATTNGAAGGATSPRARSERRDPPPVLAKVTEPAAEPVTISWLPGKLEDPRSPASPCALESAVERISTRGNRGQDLKHAVTVGRPAGEATGKNLPTTSAPRGKSPRTHRSTDDDSETIVRWSFGGTGEPLPLCRLPLASPCRLSTQ